MREKDLEFHCRLKLVKPIHVGASILELIKVLVYDFHYNCIKNE